MNLPESPKPRPRRSLHAVVGRLYRRAHLELVLWRYGKKGTWTEKNDLFETFEDLRAVLRGEEPPNAKADRSDEANPSNSAD